MRGAGAHSILLVSGCICMGGMMRRESARRLVDAGKMGLATLLSASLLMTAVGPECSRAVAAGLATPVSVGRATGSLPYTPVSSARLGDLQYLMQTASGKALIAQNPSMGFLLRLVPSTEELRVLGAMAEYLPEDFDSRLGDALDSNDEDQIAPWTKIVAEAVEKAAPGVKAAIGARTWGIDDAEALKPWALYGETVQVEIRNAEVTALAARNARTLGSFAKIALGVSDAGKAGASSIGDDGEHKTVGLNFFRSGKGGAASDGLVAWGEGHSFVDRTGQSVDTYYTYHTETGADGSEHLYGLSFFIPEGAVAGGPTFLKTDMGTILRKTGELLRFGGLRVSLPSGFLEELDRRRLSAEAHERDYALSVPGRQEREGTAKGADASRRLESLSLDSTGAPQSTTPSKPEDVNNWRLTPYNWAWIVGSVVFTGIAGWVGWSLPMGLAVALSLVFGHMLLGMHIAMVGLNKLGVSEESLFDSAMIGGLVGTIAGFFGACYLVASAYALSAPYATALMLASGSLLARVGELLSTRWHGDPRWWL